MYIFYYKSLSFYYGMDIGYFQDIYVEKHFKDKVNSAEQAELSWGAK